MLALRDKHRFWPSLLHMLVLGVAAQTHPSVLLLVVASAVLWARGFFRLHGGAVGLALLLTAASLVPWLTTVAADASLLPLQADRPYRLLQPFYGAAKGVGYWLRFSSLYFSGTIRCLDFSAFVGPAFWQAVKPLSKGLLVALGIASMLLPVWSNFRFWRGALRRRPAGKLWGSCTPRSW